MKTYIGFLIAFWVILFFISYLTEKMSDIKERIAKLEVKVEYLEKKGSNS